MSGGARAVSGALLVSLLFIGLGACSSNEPAEVTLSGSSQPTRIENLPVPSEAILQSVDPCTTTFPCNGELWLLHEDITLTEVKGWYERELPSTTRLDGGWEPCFDGRFDSFGVQPDGQETVGLHWRIGDTRHLVLRAATGESGRVEITLMDAYTPGQACQ